MADKEKLNQIELLKKKANQLKKEVDYYNALQLALKLVLNGSYGAFATGYFILYNKNVAGTITAQGRDLSKTMDKFNAKYWYENWHLDYDFHKKLGVKNVKKIKKEDYEVSIYGDTDSLFVSFNAAIENCDWKDLIFNKKYLESITDKFVILTYHDVVKFDNPNCVGNFKIHEEVLHSNLISDFKNSLNENPDLILIDGAYIVDRELRNLIKENSLESKIKWNWGNEKDFILGMDHFRVGGYFKKKLEEYASSFGIENKEDFELEKILESVISITKKKYIMNIRHEDGMSFEKLSYIYPKGVELVRSSTPLFAREKIINIVNYLFSNPKTFNIKDLLKLVKDLRREFELADMDDISMQTSVSNYENKTINDKTLPLRFALGAHFSVKATGYYNYLLNKNKEQQQKYEFIKSGSKIKYYYCKDTAINNVFAYIRGSYPIEFAPEIDYNLQFSKSILSPINSIIEPLNMPVITDRLKIVTGFFLNDNVDVSRETENEDIDKSDNFFDDF